MKANDIQHGGNHYRDAIYQHWDWAIDCELKYLEGCITKYVFRWRRKNGLEDLKKAWHFAIKLREGIESGKVLRPRRSEELEIAKRTERFIKENGVPEEEALICSLAVLWTDVEQVQSMIFILEDLIAKEEITEG